MLKEDFYFKGDQVDELIRGFGNSSDKAGFWCHRNPRYMIDDCLRNCPDRLRCSELFPRHSIFSKNEWQWEHGWFDWALMSFYDHYRFPKPLPSSFCTKGDVQK